MKFTKLFSVSLIVAAILSACGSETKSNPNSAPNGYNPVPQQNPQHSQGPVEQPPMPQQPIQPTNPPGPAGGPGFGGPTMPPGPTNPPGPVGGPDYPGYGPGPSYGGPGMPPPPVDPNIGYLPPVGQPMGYPHCEQYFNRLQTPFAPQPVLPPQMAGPMARQCWDGRYDLRRYNEMYFFFASFQVQHGASYRPLCNGRTAVRITTAIYEQAGGRFDRRVFERHYHHCLRRGFVGVQAVQEAFYMMNIRINVQEFII